MITSLLLAGYLTAGAVVLGTPLGFTAGSAVSTRRARRERRDRARAAWREAWAAERAV